MREGDRYSSDMLRFSSISWFLQATLCHSTAARSAKPAGGPKRSDREHAAIQKEEQMLLLLILVLILLILFGGWGYRRRW